MLNARLAALILLGAVSARAIGQDGPIELFDAHGAFPGAAQLEEPAADATHRLRVAIGGGFAVAPKFPGNDGYRAHLVPAVHLAYGPVFFGVGGLGVNLHRDSRWRFGVHLAPSRGRKASDDPRVQGLGDVGSTLRAGLFGAYADRGVLVRANLSTDIGGEKQGTLARLDVFGRFRAGERLGFFAGPGLTWSDQRYMQRFFGVSAEQSARSGLPQFDAKAGVSSLRLSAGALYRLDRRWRLVTSYSIARLEGDAGASPITETRTQQHFFVSATYLLR